MSAKIKGLTRPNRPVCKLDLRSTVRSMIGNIKETLSPKTGMWKKQVLQDPRYVDTVEACCMQCCKVIQAILMSNGTYVDTVDTVELQCRS